MPNQFNGLPTHPLVIHAAVVFVLLSALLGVMFVLPRFRSWSRWPLLLVSLASVVSVYLAKLSGDALRNTLSGGQSAAWNASPIGKLVNQHAHLGNQLLIITAAYAVVAIAAFVLTRGRASFMGITRWVVCVLLVVGAVALGVQTYRVGDAGARAVWNPTGTLNYG
ncbi:MAG: DUF2231 domain-containing protein [Nocardioidaceae bacterium]